MGISDRAGTSLDWMAALEAFKVALAPAFGRAETRGSAGAFIDGLLSGVERKTGWMLAEQAGLARPYRIQSLLGRSAWDANRLRDLVRERTMEAIGDPDGVLAIDETGFLKKGVHSVGVARQYSGTAGRIENCQVGVFLAFAGRYGQALIDRRLYLPKVWAEDADRRERAGVPADVAFATKPVIACAMIASALDAGVACSYVLADSVYGSDRRLRRMLEERGQPYVLAVRSNHHLRFLEEDWTLIQTDPATIADDLDEADWRALSTGEGSKGPRLYHWARVWLGWAKDERFERWLLIRRSLRNPDELAYYFAFARAGTGLPDLAGAAGLRWTIEECFLRAKDDLGLDHCEARSWSAWHRHMTFVMAAATFLSGIAADQRRASYTNADDGKRDKTSPSRAAA
jgi:SRSO17 transposase